MTLAGRFIYIFTTHIDITYLLLALEFLFIKDYWLLITIHVFILILGLYPKEWKGNVIYHCQRGVLVAICY